MQMNSELVEKAKKIRAFIFDVDGALTDGGIYIDNNGIESKKFNIKDGWAIVKAKELGFVTGIITGKTSHVVEVRARDLKIDFVRQGVKYKNEAYLEFKKEFNLNDEEIAYIGDDLIDLPILTKCGFASAPADAANEVLDIAHFASKYRGGDGAVREMIEFVLKSQELWDDIVESLKSKI
jgi:3-deoxy-D-manno-octulosonate 8-phosphate phosphatase (KDO 8-P phosphatase)